MNKEAAGLSAKEEKELQKLLKDLQTSPQDPEAAQHVGTLLQKAGEREEAATFLRQAFQGFIKNKQYPQAVKAAEELFALEPSDVEVLHQLSQVAETEKLQIPILEIYKKHKDLHGLPLFTELNEVEFLQLLKGAHFQHLKAKKAIIKEGEKGDAIYLIVEGQVRVTKKTAQKKTLVLGCLRKGDFLGEIAYMSDRKRSASIIAETPCQLLSWTGETIRELGRKHPQIIQMLYRISWDRSLDTVLKLSPFFSALDEKEQAWVKRKFQVKYYIPNEIILHEGKENLENMLYIIKKGRASVLNKESGDFKHPIATLKVGDIFGEFSALTGKAPTATVMAETPLEVLSLSQTTLKDIIRDHPDSARSLEEAGVERISNTLLYMSYFQVLEESKEGIELNLPDPETE